MVKRLLGKAFTRDERPCGHTVLHRYLPTTCRRQTDYVEVVHMLFKKYRI